MYLSINEESIAENFLYPYYSIAEACLQEDIQNNDYELTNLTAFIEGSDYSGLKQVVKSAGAGAIIGGLSGLGLGGSIGYTKAKNSNSPNFIQRKIASLRKLYAIWLAKAKLETNLGKANLFKRIAVKIMNAIDNLLKRLEYLRRNKGSKTDTAKSVIKSGLKGAAIGSAAGALTTGYITGSLNLLDKAMN